MNSTLAPQDIVTDVPLREFVQTYRNPSSGRIWQVVTRFWREDQPGALGGETDPLLPGLVVTQYAFRVDDGHVLESVTLTDR